MRISTQNKILDTWPVCVQRLAEMVHGQPVPPHGAGGSTPSFT